MLGNMKDKHPIQFVGFQGHEEVTDASIARITAAMNRTKGYFI
jgi:hypothetical protein